MIIRLVHHLTTEIGSSTTDRNRLSINEIIHRTTIVLRCQRLLIKIEKITTYVSQTTINLSDQLKFGDKTRNKGE